MKKLTYSEALLKLREGETIRCQKGSRKDNREIVCSEQRLKYLQGLKTNGIQPCEYFENLHEEKVPENAMKISFDEAYKMVHAGKNSVYFLLNGKEMEVLSISHLMSLKRSERIGEELLLLVHE